MPNSVGVAVGCCGFAGARDAYFRQFGVVEMQQSFLEPPPLHAAAKLAAEAPAGFRFCVRAWQIITHEPGSPSYEQLSARLDAARQRGAGHFKTSDVVWRAWQVTRDYARAMKASALLFQTPASFRPTPANISNMRQFFQSAQRDARILDLDFEYAWEPHATWPATLIGELCKELGLIHAVDPLAQEPVTRGTCYFRLPGIGDYRRHYREADLMKLAEKTRQFPVGYCFFGNYPMHVDAEQFLRALEGRGPLSA